MCCSGSLFSVPSVFLLLHVFLPLIHCLLFLFHFPHRHFLFLPLLAVLCLTLLWSMEKKLLNFVSNNHKPVLNSGSQ